MDRLTKRIKGIVVYTCGKYEDTTPGEMESWDVRDVITRLAEYEDTGLTPEEIKEHEEIFAAYRHVCGGRLPEEVKRALKLLDETNEDLMAHGKWKRVEDGRAYWFACSECGEMTPKSQWGDNDFSEYCPNCGAKMDEERE